MAIVVYHGSNGSYKTASAVHDWLVPAAREGRVVVTNIRGLRSTDDVIERLARLVPRWSGAGDGFQVHYLNSDDADDLRRLRTWWHWAPRGALLLIDEAQVIFPRKWRQSDIDSLSCPDDLRRRDARGDDDLRPETFLQAWTMHRHFGWDVVLTTPDIALIRDEIRATTEGARLQQNLAFIGLRGFFKRRIHHGRHSGASDSHVISSSIERMPSWVFGVYESTTLDVARESGAGKPIWRDPKVVGLLGLVVLLFSYAGSRGVKTFESVDSQKSEGAGVAVSSGLDSGGASDGKIAGVVGRSGSGVYRGRGDLASGSRLGVVASDIRSALVSPEIYIVGSLRVRGDRPLYYFEIPLSDDEWISLSSDDIRELGYKVSWHGPCHASLVGKSNVYTVFCRGWHGRADMAAATLFADDVGSMPVAGEQGASTLGARSDDAGRHDASGFDES
jgi:zona occludens toxin